MRLLAYKIAYFVAALALLGALGFGLFWGDKSAGIAQDQSLTLPFETDANHSVVLLYFGYVGCQAVCTPMLEELHELYAHIKQPQKVGLYFINLSTPTYGAQEFASFFDARFRGIDLEPSARHALMRQLQVYLSDGLVDKNDLQHTPYIYLLTPEKSGFRLKYLFITHPLQKTTLIENINKETL